MSGTALAPIFLTGTAPLCFIDMNWLILLAAGFFEIIWALGLKYADGFTKFWPSVFTLVATTISFVLVSFAMRTIPVGTAYAVWTGIGVLGAATFGIILFGDSVAPIRIFCLALIAVGIVGLKIFSPE